MAEYFVKDGDGYKPVSENLLTQTDVDSVVEKRLERERNKFADYESLREKAGKVDEVTSEFTEKLKAASDAKAELEGKLKKATLETEKVKIIHEFKLSDELAEFVDGESADDMRKRAEKLAKGVGGGGVPIHKTPKPGETTSDTKKAAQEIFGKKSGD